MFLSGAWASSRAGGSTALAAGLCILYGKLIQAINYVPIQSFHQHHERFIVRGSWGLEITVAARMAHNLSGWAWCPRLEEDGCFILVWEKTDSNLNGEIMGTKDKLLHSICPSSHWDLESALLWPHPCPLHPNLPKDRTAASGVLRPCTGFGLWTLK